MKLNSMSIELLPSEIFFEIFDYLDHVDLYHSFFNLNHRFNDILLHYFRVSSRVNLQSMTKFDLDVACHYLIPSMTDKIHAIRLSNDDDTPQQIDRFLSYGLFRLLHLQSLSLDSMHSESIINRMVIECRYLIDLTRVNITNCRVLSEWVVAHTLIDTIWSLPKLTYCQLDIEVTDEIESILPTVISPTLESLSIKNMHYDLEKLISLFEFTPRLRYLDITMNDEDVYVPPLSFSIPLMTTFKLAHKGSFDALESLLQCVPNLTHLTLRTKDVDANGDDWARIIGNYLPKLKNFHLLMELDAPDNYGFALNQSINTYKSDFWLKERQWYVRGHPYYNRDRRGTILLYTLPYIFNDYFIHSTAYYQSFEFNFSNFNDALMYERVHHLSCISLPSCIYRICYRFYHVAHLVVQLPFDNNFWTLLPTFHRLRILDISTTYSTAYDKDALFQLQMLLDQAPKLHSLTFRTSIKSLLPLLECSSKSVIKLDLQTSEEYFDQSNCPTLFLSILGQQCQVLSIRVADRMTIVQLIKEMPQLHALNIELPSSSDDDQLIRWLQYQLPSSCMITRDFTFLNRIQIWIR